MAEHTLIVDDSVSLRRGLRHRAMDAGLDGVVPARAAVVPVVGPGPDLILRDLDPTETVGPTSVDRIADRQRIDPV